MAKPRAKDAPEGLQRFTEREFEPYALAIGQFCLAWNDLHERLGVLFILLSQDKYLSRPAAVWQSAHYDRPKRDMLKALMDTVPMLALIEKLPKLGEEISWILGQTDALEDKRNTIIHTPFQWGPPYIGDQPDGRKGVRPNLFLGHQRAHRLSKISFQKPILEEIKWAHAAVLVLRDYAVSIESVLVSHGEEPWPDRPQLPNRGAPAEAKYQRGAKPPRRHQPSRG